MHTKSNRPSLLRAGIIFGAAMVASLGIGILLHSGEPAREKQQASVLRANGQPTARPLRSAAPSPAAAQSRTAPPAGIQAAAASVESASTVPAATPATEAQPTPDPTPTTAGQLVPLTPVSYPEAEAAYLRGDFEEAALAFARFTEESPENFWGHYMSGLSHRKTGQLAEAEAAFEAALDIRPEHGKSLVNLARTFLDADRAADALPVVTRAVEVDPASGDAQRVLGRVLHTIDRRVEAEEAYLAAIKIDETDAWSLNNLGLLRIEEQRFEEAVPVLHLACGLNDQVACFQNNLGVALEQVGDLVAAAAAYDKATNLDAGYVKARVSLARVEARIGSSPSPVELASSDEADADEEGEDAAPADGSIE